MSANNIPLPSFNKKLSTNTVKAFSVTFPRSFFLWWMTSPRCDLEWPRVALQMTHIPATRWKKRERIGGFLTWLVFLCFLFFPFFADFFCHKKFLLTSFAGGFAILRSAGSLISCSSLPLLLNLYVSLFPSWSGKLDFNWNAISQCNVLSLLLEIIQLIDTATDQIHIHKPVEFTCPV